jgi:hypothetical protein
MYLGNRLKTRHGDKSEITFSDYHLQFHHWASTTLVNPQLAPQGPVDAWTTCRECGKSTTSHCALLWGFCHGHTPFIVVISASDEQSRMHLTSMTEMLKGSKALKLDFPHAVPQRTQRLTQEERELQEDRVDFFRTKAGIIISRPVTGSMAGTLVGGQRPQLLWLDDVEQIGEGYSANMAEKRLDTVLTNVLPLGGQARVLITMTNQMHGSIADHFKRSVEATNEAQLGQVHAKPQPSDDLPEWLEDINPTIHWVRPLITRPDGTKRSLWPNGPAMFSTPYLLEIEGSRKYAERYDCQPWISSGIAFSRDMFQQGTIESSSFTVLSVDHARTAKGGDYSALGVIRYSRVKDQFEVSYATAVHVTGAQLRTKIVALLQAYPEIKAVLIESPVGQDFLDPGAGLYHDLPGVNLINVEQKHYGTKEVRYELASVEFFHKRVWFAEKMPLLESTLLSWPKVAHDDLSDVVITAICVIRKMVQEEKNKQLSPRSALAGKSSYAGFYNR